MNTHFPQFTVCPECKGKKEKSPSRSDAVSISVIWCERCNGSGVVQIDKDGERPYMPKSG